MLTSGADQTLTVRDLTQTALADEVSPPFSVLTEPTVSTPAGVSVGAKAAGTGFPGATVTVTIAGTRAGTSTTVTALVTSSGAWQAVLPAASVPSGTYAVSAVQRSSAVPAVPVSSASRSVSIVVDRTAPPPPVVLHPRAGSTVRGQPFVFDGTGEDGATVTTYVDSNPVCTAVVAKGRWSCSTTGLLIPSGTRAVQAAERDAAGNYGAPSSAATIVFAPATTPSPSQSQGQSQTPQPSHTSSPAPGPTSTASPPGTGGSSGGGAAGGSGGTGGPGGDSGSGSSGSSGSTGGGGPGSAAAASWTAPTGFGHDLPTLAQTFASWAWLWALLLGAVFALLVIAPMRLAASALGGRLAVRARRVTGRNRVRATHDESPLLPPVAAAIAALVGGAVLIAVAFGVDDQLRYLRLVTAIAIGLAVLNALASVLPTILVGRRLGLRLRLEVSPRMILLAALACIATRALDLDPPLVLGLLVMAGLVDDDGATLDSTGDVRRGGIVAVVQLGSLALVSFGAWVAHGLVSTTPSSFGSEITREALATTALAGLGSLIVLLVPIGGLPGRAVWSWSKSTLLGLGVVGAALAAVVYAGSPGEAFPILPLVVSAVVFAVIALSAWVWVRFVEPVVDDAV